MKWWSVLKEGGAVVFGGHGANPLMNIVYGSKMNRKNLNQEEDDEEEDEIAKD